MDPDEQKKPAGDTGASFSLPGSAPSQPDDNLAADLVRKKVEAAYASEPDASEEALDVAEIGVNSKLSKHQKFIYELTNSGKSLADIQAGWHEYYAGLPDSEKHQVWREFYSAHAQASHYAAATQTMAPSPPMEYETTPVSHSQTSHKPRKKGPVSRTIADMRDYVLGNVGSSKKLKPMQHLQSLAFGLGIGCLVMLIFLFGFFNERFIAPFIQPSRTVSNLPIIDSGAAVGKAPEIIIPKINVEIPVVYDVKTIDDNAIETALERGVVHYADTPSPGQDGNLVIVGHSSNNIFNPGKYKFAFVLLSHLDNGDTFYLQKGGKRYTYQVYKKEIVKPTDVNVLGSQDKPATATLITCDPPGTSTNRLVVVGQQISPNPNTNLAASSSSNQLATKAAIIPSESPSLWSRFTHWLFH